MLNTYGVYIYSYDYCLWVEYFTGFTGKTEELYLEIIVNFKAGLYIQLPISLSI